MRWWLARRIHQSLLWFFESRQWVRNSILLLWSRSRTLCGSFLNRVVVQLSGHIRYTCQRVAGDNRLDDRVERRNVQSGSRVCEPHFWFLRSVRNLPLFSVAPAFGPMGWIILCGTGGLGFAEGGGRSGQSGYNSRNRSKNAFFFKMPLRLVAIFNIIHFCFIIIFVRFLCCHFSKNATENMFLSENGQQCNVRLL